MPKRQRRLAKLRVISWNVYVGNTPAVIRAALILLAALFRPHVIALQEARRFTGSIPGYRRLAADGLKRPDATQNILLVRRGRRTRVRDHGPVLVPGDGWAYNGNPKPARTFYGAAIERLGVLFHVLDVHRCVGGPRGNSPEEWWAEDQVIVEWRNQVPDTDPLAVVGDHNDRPDPGDADRRGTVPDLAERIDARILTAGGIDYALIRRCAGYIRALIRLFGSDHAPRLITLTAPRPRLEAELITRRISAEQQIPLPG